jgi:hypothetical protein
VVSFATWNYTSQLLSLITCAAPVASRIGQPESGDLLQKRIHRVLAIAHAFGYSALVLGAWVAVLSETIRAARGKISDTPLKLISVEHLPLSCLLSPTGLPKEDFSARFEMFLFKRSWRRFESFKGSTFENLRAG